MSVDMTLIFRTYILLALIVWSFVGVSPASADIYRFVDAQGLVHFTNTPTTGKYRLYRKEGGSSSSTQVHSYGDIIKSNAGRFNLEEALVKAVIKVESNYRSRVTSKKGAQGLMQLIPETARDLNVVNPFNPSENIRGGSEYLRKMLDLFNNDLELALAAYNAGPGTVKRYGGIPPYEETRNYVNRVKHYLDYYRSAGDTLL
jgi:soluble lytic murein transglycosylase